MTDISHETIHMAEKEETNQNIEIVERPRRRQKNENHHQNQRR